MDPRRMNAMMRQLGIDVKDVADVQRVVIQTATKDIVIDDASVTIMKAQGQETFQVVGKAREEQHDVKLIYTAEDVAMVVEQAGCSEDDAKAALDASGGDLAEAILQLSGDAS